MQYLASRDFIHIRRMSLIGDHDRQLLAELYQPLISHQGLALFLTLDALSHLFMSDEAMAVSMLISHTQMTLSDLSLAKARLEAVGLLRSYRKKQQDFEVHVLELFAPKSPALFFDDVLLRGLLSQYIGEAMVQKLRVRYHKPKPIVGFDEVSASFGEVFHPDYTLPSFNGKSDNGILDHRCSSIETKFDRRSFIDEIGRKSNIKTQMFTTPLLDEIDRLANLYGIDELAMAELVVTCFIGEDERIIDFNKLKEMAALETKFAFAKTRRKSLSQVSSATSKARKIQLMEQSDPKTYFRYRNLNNAPAPADLKVINDMQTRYDLPLPVINALIDYVLESANLTFPRPLVEKIAASLARAQVTSAIDAMEYLVKTRKKKSSTSKEKEKLEEPATPPQEEEIDLDAMLEALENERAGKKHGKS